MLKVRKLKKYDWDFLPKWWEKYNQEPWLYTENFKDILPNLGFLVHNEKTTNCRNVAWFNQFKFCTSNSSHI